MNSSISHNGREFELRRATVRDVVEVRSLLNRAYKELSDRGWNYTATYQDDAFTAQQILERRVFLVSDGERPIATISVHDQNEFTNRKTLYVGKFAVHPELKNQGLGARLIDYVEGIAKSEGYDGLQLDTAKPAEHLVSWYQRLGYRIVGETRYEGKTYESWIFEKLI
jgi:ribosomal protein S18 acetylase RimI-like enzyme